MDDLGFGDVEYFKNQHFSGENSDFPTIKTPNLDLLAKSSAVLMHHYSGAPVCAPSRASLLSGLSQGHANVRNNQFDKQLADNHTLGTIFQGNGYRTALIGKWGLQGTGEAPYWEAHPRNRGFDYFLGYMRHRDGHEHYPKEGIYRGSKEVWENFTNISPLLDKCYSGDLWTAGAKRWIKKNKKSPFFLLLAYDTPHAVLELPTMAYPNKIGENQGLLWTGNQGSMITSATGVPDSWIDPIYINKKYDHDGNPSTPSQPWPDTFKRYATIITRIDHQVADIVATLKDLQVFENTIIVFTSDNGPSDESYLPKDYKNFTPEFFRSAGEFDGMKRDLWEGGVRVPTIVSWPNEILGSIQIDEPTSFYDWLPTFTEILGVQAPVNSDGNSFFDLLKGSKENKNGAVYIEYFHPGQTPDYPSIDPQHRGRKRNDMQMFRFGDTLAVRYNISQFDDSFEIYNLQKDPFQKRNLKDLVSSELQTKIQHQILRFRLPDTTAKRPYDKVPVPGYKSAVDTLYNWSFFKGSYPWIPNTDGLKPALKGVSNSFELDKVFPEGILKITKDIYIENTGKYTFKITGELPFFLKIHGINLIDADYSFDEKKVYTKSIILQKGYHPVQLYQKIQGNSGINQLNWTFISSKK
jgi:arylsulfatase A-like enzyme